MNMPKIKPGDGLRSTRFGDLTVYKEYKPRTDMIEFTVYGTFDEENYIVYENRDGVISETPVDWSNYELGARRYRLDFELAASDFSNSGDRENYLAYLIESKVQEAYDTDDFYGMHVEKRSKVELVSEIGVELISCSANDNMVAMAAWVSNDADSAERLKDQDGVAKLINFLYREKHMSPFEHGLFTFKVDVPLFVAREWHRHRTMSYNEVSGRYTEMKPRFWVGKEARVQKGKMGNYYFEPADDNATAMYIQSNRRMAEAQWTEYQHRLSWGIAKEQAREVLGLNLMTQFYVTVNPRNLMQFLMLRNDSHALKEIREAAEQIEAVFKEQMPLTYKAFAKYRKRERWAAQQKESVWTHYVEDRSAVEVLQQDIKEKRNMIINMKHNVDVENERELNNRVTDALQRSFDRRGRT